MDCAHLCNDNNHGEISELSVKIPPIATPFLTMSFTIFMLLRSVGAELNYFVSFFSKEAIRSHKRGPISKENI